MSEVKDGIIKATKVFNRGKPKTILQHVIGPKIADKGIRRVIE